MTTVACPGAKDFFWYEIHCYGFLEDGYILGAGQQLVQGRIFVSSETILSVHPGEISSGYLISTIKDATEDMNILIYQDCWEITGDGSYLLDHVHSQDTFILLWNIDREK